MGEPVTTILLKIRDTIKALMGGISPANPMTSVTNPGVSNRALDKGAGGT